ncbi:lysine N(6)-hydroxylase/L-ornithine N(5)-oxygenase family protein [Kitasatospora sp. LaBMicrA B282]|uniref:lysine N(6)-hydroxylase/L-ornithine N(5)-oxygenase family protein n=1 Tax=Kitasatospora sp. LaBMicrA B282 TaxID=3420949 RepID=UPI003D0CB071
MGIQEVDVLAVGGGPANLAFAVGVEEMAPELAARTLVVDDHEAPVWQPGLLIPWTQSQVSFLKDLVTMRNPRSRFSFVNFLHSTGRLDEFVNLGSFTPYRLEISNYLRWVAESLSLVRVAHGRRAERIEPVRAAGGAIVGWQTRFTDGSAVESRSLSIGIGREPHIPEVFKALPAERVIHSTSYTQRIGALDPAGAHRVVVVGGAQSAAEMLYATHQAMPNAQVTMVMRAIGLNGYESSKFTNELYYASFVDEFFDAQPEARTQLLAEMHRSNYAGLAPATLDTLYRQMYLERLTGAERMHITPMVDITDAQLDGDEVVLTLADRKTGALRELRCDVVLLGTGFQKTMPSLIRQLADSAELEDIRVTRNYRLELPASASASVYLQGVNEASHGISDSLLSVLGTRGGRIVEDLLAHRADTDLAAVPAA